MFAPQQYIAMALMGSVGSKPPPAGDIMAYENGDFMAYGNGDIMTYTTVIPNDSMSYDDGEAMAYDNGDFMEYSE